VWPASRAKWHCFQGCEKEYKQVPPPEASVHAAVQGIWLAGHAFGFTYLSSKQVGTPSTAVVVALFINGCLLTCWQSCSIHVTKAGSVSVELCELTSAG
jgi:hypothetical protein